MAFGKKQKNQVVVDQGPSIGEVPDAQQAPEPSEPKTGPTDKQTGQTKGASTMSRTSSWPGLGDELLTVEPGLYTVEVFSLKEVSSKSSGEPMLVLGVTIMDDGKFQGRKVFTNFVKSSDVARQIFARFAKAIGLEIKVDEFNPESAVGARLRVQVRNRVNEQTDEVRADIERFLPL